MAHPGLVLEHSYSNTETVVRNPLHLKVLSFFHLFEHERKFVVSISSLLFKSSHVVLQPRPVLAGLWDSEACLVAGNDRAQDKDGTQLLNSRRRLDYLLPRFIYLSAYLVEGLSRTTCRTDMDVDKVRVALER